jgi:hypothetical protein
MGKRLSNLWPSTNDFTNTATRTLISVQGKQAVAEIGIVKVRKPTFIA